MERCDECGFVYADLGGADLPARLAGFGGRYRDRLLPADRDEHWGQALRAHPEPGIWSGLEYASHVRDVFLAQRERLYLALVEERPSFVPMYRDHRVSLARYNDGDPARVAIELDVATGLLAGAFSVLSQDQLQRLCVYNFPQTSERTLLWLGQHTAHEGEHHLRDLEAAIARAHRNAT